MKRSNTPKVDALEEFAKESDTKFRASLTNEIKALRHLQHVLVPATGAAYSEAKEALAIAQSSWLEAGITKVLTDARKGKSAHELDIGDDPVKEARASVDEAERLMTVTEKAVVAGERHISALVAQDPHIADQVATVWKTGVHPSLDPSKTTVVKMEEAKARAVALMPLCHRVVELIDQPATKDEEKRLRAAFSARPSDLPRLGPILKEIRTEQATRQAQAERIASQGRSFSNFGNNLGVRDRT